MWSAIRSSRSRSWRVSRRTCCATSPCSSASRSSSRCRNSAPSCTAITPTAVSSRPRRWSRGSRSIRCAASTSRPTAPAARGLYVVGRFDSSGGRGGDSQDLRRMGEGQRARAAAAQADLDACGAHHRPPGRAAVDGHSGRPDRRSLEPGLHPADRHGRAARRRLRLPHHQEHPRGQGLYLLAIQRDLGAVSRCVLVRERRRDDDRDRAVDQGDPCRDRPAAGRAAEARRN